MEQGQQLAGDQYASDLDDHHYLINTCAVIAADGLYKRDVFRKHFHEHSEYGV